MKIRASKIEGFVQAIIARARLHGDNCRTYHSASSRQDNGCQLRGTFLAGWNGLTARNGAKTMSRKIVVNEGREDPGGVIAEHATSAVCSLPTMVSSRNMPCSRGARHFASYARASALRNECHTRVDLA
jgi:hypothetical protein